MCVEDNQFLECLEFEQKTECKPTFSTVIKDVEVVEGSAARFDCKIEGTRAERIKPIQRIQEYKTHLTLKTVTKNRKSWPMDTLPQGCQTDP